MRRRAVLEAGVTGALVAGGAHPAIAEVTTSSERITVWDGTEIAATVYDPPDQRGVPAVLMTHGYGGTNDSVRREANRYVSNGYLVVAYDSRGFGESGGVSGFNGPKEFGTSRHWWIGWPLTTASSRAAVRTPASGWTAGRTAAGSS
jgi:predicted acyl esterase